MVIGAARATEIHGRVKEQYRASRVGSEEEGETRLAVKGMGRQE